MLSFELDGRQHPVPDGLAHWVVDHFDVIEHVLASSRVLWVRRRMRSRLSRLKKLSATALSWQLHLRLIECSRLWALVKAAPSMLVNCEPLPYVRPVVFGAWAWMASTTRSLIPAVQDADLNVCRHAWFGWIAGAAILTSLRTHAARRFPYLLEMAVAVRRNPLKVRIVQIPSTSATSSLCNWLISLTRRSRFNSDTVSCNVALSGRSTSRSRRLLIHRVSVDRPTPRSSAISRRVRPLVRARRTASSSNSFVKCFGMEFTFQVRKTLHFSEASPGFAGGGWLYPKAVRAEGSLVMCWLPIRNCAVALLT